MAFMACVTLLTNDKRASELCVCNVRFQFLHENVSQCSNCVAMFNIYGLHFYNMFCREERMVICGVYIWWPPNLPTSNKGQP